MTAAGPWSVKGIDPKAREMAKDLARRSGMTLGEWLNQMIIDGVEVDAPPPPFESELAAYGHSSQPYSDRPAQRAPERRRLLDDMYREATFAQDAESQMRRDERHRRSPERPRRDNGLRGQILRGETSHADVATDEMELGRITRALETLSDRLESAEHRSTLAISGIDQSVMGVLSRLDSMDDAQSDAVIRLETSIEQVRDTQARVAERVRRMEADDSTRADALRALESALGRLAGQIHEGTSRAEAAAHQTREDVEALGRRVNRVEVAGEAGASRADVEAISNRVQQVEVALARAPDAYADAEKVETVLARLSERLERAEARTTAAVKSLETSFAGLDSRLRTTEAHTAEADVGLERRFQALANEFSQKVESSRADFAEQIRKVASGEKLGQLEASLRDLTRQAAQAEKQSAQAIDRIGREVVNIAQSLGERVAGAEARSAAVVGQMTGEITRLGETVENRLARADANQAEALERLGGEIARIAERLNERITASEHRAAKAVDEATSRFARLTDGLSERQDRTANDLTDRIKQSETRTAKLLEEARESLEAHVEQSISKATSLAPQPLAREPEPVSLRTNPPPSSRPAPETFPDSYDPFEALDPASFLSPTLGANQSKPDAFASRAAQRDQAPPPSLAAHAHADAFESNPFDPDDDFLAPATGHGSDLYSGGMTSFAATDAFVHDSPTEPVADKTLAPGDAAPRDFAPEPQMGVRSNSTRDMLDQARAAARRASGGKDQPPPLGVLAPPPELDSDERPLGARFGKKPKKDAGGSTLRTMALASGWACALTAAGYGAYSLAVHDGSAPPKPQIADLAETPTAAPPMTPSGEPKAQQAAVALASTSSITSPTAAGPASAAAAADQKSAPPNPALAKPDDAKAMRQSAPAEAKAGSTDNAQSLYDKAVRQVSAGDKSGLANLKRAANLGFAPAQFYLARMYDAGSGGVAKDLVEARRLTAMAAQGGDPSAMYNYASYLFDGEGGAKDATAAAGWFRKAAEHGIVNGQYNLAQLYETGHGVALNTGEAYKWYLVAAASGDDQAKQNAEALKKSLPANVRAAAEASAAAIHAQAANPAHLASAGKSSPNR